MKKLKDLKTFEFRLMPNLFDLKKNIIEHRLSTKRSIDGRIKSLDKLEKYNNSFFWRPIYKYFSYIQSEDNIYFAVLNTKIKDICNAFMSGDICINSDGLILGRNTNDSKYYTIGKDGFIEFTDEKSIDTRSDIRNIDNLNLFDIKTGYKIQFEYKVIEGFDHYFNFKFIEDKPLWDVSIDRIEFKNKLDEKYSSIKFDKMIAEYFAKSREESNDLLIDDEIANYIKTLNGDAKTPTLDI